MPALVYNIYGGEFKFYSPKTRLSSSEGGKRNVGSAFEGKRVVRQRAKAF